MKRLCFSIGILLLLAGNVFSQVNCDSVVSDPAGVLGRGLAQVESNANALIQQGADVRVRTVLNVSNLDSFEKSMERACLSWQAPNGGRKTTLIVLMVAPNEHKMGIYYGAAFNTALADHWNRIKQQYMAPNFKAGDYATGFALAEAQLAKRIGAAQDEALHPATSTTINQQAATDYSGLWSFFKWLLFFGIFAGAIWAVVYFIRARRKSAEVIAQAQIRAIGVRNRTARLVNSLIAEFKVPPAKQTAFDLLTESYSQFSSSVKGDPEQSGLSATEYTSIGNMYQSILDQLTQLMAPVSPASSQRASSPPKPQPTKSQPPTPRADYARPKAGGSHTTTVKQSTVHETTVIPVFVDNTRLDDVPATHSKPSRFSSSSDDDSGDGGGSSSWGSSDSSSSSSDDGGGSSSFDSGSSDSGGSDSGGGGGSSDF